MVSNMSKLVFLLIVVDDEYNHMTILIPFLDILSTSFVIINIVLADLGLVVVMKS